MEPDDRKRKADRLDRGNTGESIVFVMERKKTKNQMPATSKRKTKPLHVQKFTASIPTGPIQKLDKANAKRSLLMTRPKTPGGKNSKMAECSGIEASGIDRDESIKEIKLLVSNCENTIRELQEKNEEWKEHVATIARKGIDSHETRLAKTETDIYGFLEKLDPIEECRNKLAAHQRDIPKNTSEIKKECRDEIDLRLRDFANHMLSFPQSLLPTGTKARVQTEPFMIKAVDESQVNQSINNQFIKTDKNTPAGIVATGAPAIDRYFLALGVSGKSLSTEPRLTNCGYQKLMRNFNFRDISQLEALCKVDNRRNLRDCNIFCDRSSLVTWVDYVVRIGGCSSFIMDDTPSVTYDNILSLAHTDLSQLRIFKLSLSAKPSAEQANFKAWKKRFNPPRYVYELGQLFVRRRFCKMKRNDVFSTVYNLVMDIANPKKPVWIIARPGYTLSQRTLDRRDSSLPFNGMDGCGIACLVENINDLSLTYDDFDRNSYTAFEDADNLVKATECKVELEINSRGADIAEMLKAFQR